MPKQNYTLIQERVVAFGVRAAAKEAFVPPLDERKVREAVRAGLLKTHLIGQRAYILRDDLVSWINSGHPWRSNRKDKANAAS